MALVTQDVRQRIDWLLRYLTQEWEAIDEVVAAWGGWSEHDRLDFRLEWPIKESNLHVLREHVAQGDLSQRQSQAYDALQRLVDHQRPALERLLDEDSC
jgi:hypothetical protein